MLAQLSQWFLIAAIGQAAPEAALAKAAPADVDVAVRIRGMEATRDDLMAMLKAMNPDWANMAEGALGGPLEQVRTHHGAMAVKTPFVVLVRIGEPGGEGGPPPLAVLLPADDYKGTLKELMGGNDVELKHQDGDYDAFDGPGGHGTWYAAKGPGLIAFGTSKTLIADIAKRPAKTLDSVLTGPASRSFSEGDVGVYINAASLTQRYSEQIDQGRQVFMGLLDQAGQQAGNASTMQMAKDIYGALFDSLKYADALTFHLDFAQKGLQLGGFLKVKPDSDIAKSITEVDSGGIAGLGKMPQGSMTYVYMNVGARAFERLEGMGLKMVASAGKPSPELEKAVAELHGHGRVETLASARMEKGMLSVKEIKTEDPKGFLDKRLAIVRAMRGDGQSGFFKEVKIEPNAQTHAGLTFVHSSCTINLDKLAELSGNNPAQVEALKGMFGDGPVNTWYGTDGKRVLEVVAPKWEEARSLVDAYLKGEGGVGQTPGFKAVLSELPGRASLILLYSAQGLTRMMANQFAAITRNPNLKVPADMPGEAAYLGASLTPHSKAGYEFHLVVPSAVGPVISKGLIPLFQGLAGGLANP